MSIEKEIKIVIEEDVPNVTKDFGIYCIRNIRNGKTYVGSTTTTFRKRWDAHIKDLNAGKHCNYRLQADWKMYGEQCFVFEVLEVAREPHNIFVLEQIWINKNKKIMSYNILRIAGAVPGRVKRKFAKAKAKK